MTATLLAIRRSREPAMRPRPFHGIPIMGILALLAATGAEPALMREAEPLPGQLEPAPASSQDRHERSPLRLIVDERGIGVLSTRAADATWRFGLRLARDGEPGELRESDYPTVANDDGRVTLIRGRLSESFSQSARGIEHVIAISRTTVSGLLHLEFTLNGTLIPKVSVDGNSVEFRNASGVVILAYRELRGVDAEDRDVSVRWERIEAGEGPSSGLRLVIHDGEHLFPIRVSASLAAPMAIPVTADPAGLAASAMSLAPANDNCAGAEVIPAAGPFPHLSSTVDITEATLAGDPAFPSCQPNVSRGVWFTFTPATTSDYTFSVCSAAPTGTTVEDTVLAVYSSTGPCTGLAELAGGCDDDSCAVTAGQSVISNIPLMAGHSYYVLAWQFGNTPPLAGAASLQLQVIQHPAPGQPPANDLCASAEPIPASGPFPYLTPVVNDIGAATTTGDPAPPSCQSNVSRSIWYSFVPASDGRYAFSLCADAPTGTTVDDTVLAVYSGSCATLLEIPSRCDDDSCAAETGQSMLQGFDLSAGTTYHIGVWQYGSQSPLPGNTAVQLRVSHVTAPVNDSCLSPEPLILDAPIRGTTVAAIDDTRLPAGSACFTGVGQVPSTAAGGDVVFAFTAPDDGMYSFRLSDYETTKNAVLYVASDCPTGTAPNTISACLAAANRGSVNPEEVSCLPLTSGQSVNVFVDENAATTGGTFTLEVNRCAREVEPNDLPGASTQPACGIEGSIAPAGDADFFALGNPAAGSRVFALVDGAAGNSTDFDLRLTTATDTLEYDDLNNDLPFGVVSPNISGTPVGGSLTYLRVSHYSATAQAEPYRLYAAIQPPAGAATPEVESNDTPATATAGGNEYYAGALSDPNDLDHFSFFAVAGELIQIGLDLDPLRDGTPFNGSLALLDSAGTTLLTVNDLSQSAGTTPGAGTLTATTPFAPAEGIVYRIRSSGVYSAKVAWSSGTPRDYLLSNAHDCRVGPATDGDGDGVPNASDCAPADPGLWAVPGPAVGLEFPAAGDTSRIQWSAPASAGGIVVRYDLLRGASANGFLSALCPASNVTLTSATDLANPGTVFFYLVRAENACGSNLGQGSDGAPRSGASCP